MLVIAASAAIADFEYALKPGDSLLKARDAIRVARKIGKVAKSLACDSDVQVERTALGDAVITIRRPMEYGFDIVVKMTLK